MHIKHVTGCLAHNRLSLNVANTGVVVVVVVVEAAVAATDWL